MKRGDDAIMMRRGDDAMTRRRDGRSARRLLVASGLAVLLIALGLSSRALDARLARAAVNAPMFEVDPLWPKPLPNHWMLGSTIGVGVDSKDHVFIVHRQQTVLANEAGAASNPPTSECCAPAPPVLEFDPDGNLVNAWGGPGQGYVWPQSNHGISVDDKDNVWIGGNGTCPANNANPACPSGGSDSHVLKFTHDGKLIAQFGVPHQPTNSNSMTSFGRVAKISFDVKAQEAFLADGYGNRRVAVIDMATGAIKRYWGGYGERPVDGPLPPYNPDSALIRSFRTPVHCAEPTNDGLVYVCDRPNDRIQVFRKDGSFVREKQIAPRTLGDGSVWDIAFSRDPQQKYLYLADGKNERIYVMDRETLEILTMFGAGGRQPGMFFAVHSIATDSKGNIYTTETYEGKRVQKFRYMGIRSVAAQNQGVVWPRRTP
jgi:DNA-binding beta-propeller fold protein YncE